MFVSFCFIDLQKAFDRLNGPDCYRWEMKIAFSGTRGNRVAIRIWNRMLK